MAERKIEIQMAAVNAAETAADISQSTAAVQGLTEATKEQADAAAERAEQARQNAEDEVEGLRKAQEADRTAMRDKVAGTAAITAAFAYAKQSISEVAEALNSVNMEQASRVDPQGAAELEKMAKWANLLDSPIKTLKDALMEGLAGDTVAGAFKDMNTALENAAKDHAAAVDRIIQSGIRQTDEIKRLADEVKAANAVLDAKDDADSAARTRADAAAIRGGADPAAVATARAHYDAEQAMAKIQREREQADAAARAAMFDAEQAQNNYLRVYVPGAKQGAVDDARASRDAKGSAAREAVNNAADFGNVANHRERKIREEEAAKIERIAAEAEDRRIAAEDATARKSAEDSAKAAREASREEERRQAAALATARGAFGVANDAEGLGAGAGGIARLRQHAAAVQANPTAGNNAELVAMVQQLLKHFETSGNQTDAKILKLKGEVQALLRREKAR